MVLINKNNKKMTIKKIEVKDLSELFNALEEMMNDNLLFNKTQENFEEEDEDEDEEYDDVNEVIRSLARENWNLNKRLVILEQEIKNIKNFIRKQVKDKNSKNFEQCKK